MYKKKNKLKGCVIAAFGFGLITACIGTPRFMIFVLAVLIVVLGISLCCH